MFVPSRALLKLILGAASSNVPSGPFKGPLFQPYLGLLTNTGPLTENTVLGDITEPTYTGYARQQIAPFAGPYESQDGDIYIDGADLNFAMGDSATPTQVTGYFLVDALHAGNYLGGELFSTPYVLTNTDQAVSLTPEAVLRKGIDLGSYVPLP